MSRGKKASTWCVITLLWTIAILVLWFMSKSEEYIPSKNARIINTKDDEHYCKINYVVRGSNTEYVRITSAITASFDRVNGSLMDKINNWDGPTSLVVVFAQNFTHEQVRCTTKALLKAHQNPKAAEYLTAHYLVEGSKTQCEKLSSIMYDSIDDTLCSPPIYSDKELLQLYTHYPINVARNYGRNMTTTKYLMIVDLEHFFSEHFESKVLALAEEKLVGNDTKLALTYRIFEVHDDYFKIKLTKADLRYLLSKNLAQQFHEFHHAHTIQRLVEWIYGDDLGPNMTTIQFIKPYTILQWEPQFVSLVEDLPYHDINFKFPFSDNRNLRWTMCRAGYQFAIMNDVFMYHPGIRTPGSNLLYDEARTKVWKHNWLYLRKFRRELDRHYPDTKKQCPVYSHI